jgi:hypothetical protein
MTTSWQVVGASVAGLGHLELDQACQDAHALRRIDGDSVIAVVCDGAGSAPRSSLGSATAAAVLCAHPAVDEWIATLTASSGESWQTSWELCASAIFRSALASLQKLVDDPASAGELATTAIVVVATPDLLACAHVGDGRACASFSSDGGWLPLFEPTRGDAPNETVFLTSFDDARGNAYWRSEARVFPSRPRAFAAMTDGCETGAFECWVPRPSGEGFHDPNRPFPPFFDPLALTLVELSRAGADEKELQRAWTSFVTAGVERFRTESDDRTLVFGAWLRDDDRA